MSGAEEQPPGVRWVTGSEDPELERRLAEELETRRRARVEERSQRRYERRARWLFGAFVVVVVALVALFAYGVFVVARQQFG